MGEKQRRLYGSGSLYQRKDGRWVGALEAGYNPNGTRRRILVTAKTQAEARRKLAAKTKQITQQGLPAPGSARISVREWFDEWFKLRAENVRPKTLTTEKSLYKSIILPSVGPRRLEYFCPADVRKVAGYAKGQGLSMATARQAQSLLMRALKAAATEGYSVPNPVFLTKVTAKGAGTREAIPIPDAVKLLNVALEEKIASRWVAALLQGMRQGECLGLTWDRVNLEAGVIDISWQLQQLPYADRAAGTFTVPEGYEYVRLHGAFHLVRPKTTKGYRMVPLVPWMITELAKWRKIAPENPYNLVWADNSGRALSPEKDRARWRELQDLAGVRKSDGSYYVVHEARHTAATLLLEAGIDSEVIKSIMGHSSVAMTQSYQHVNQDMTRKALESVSGMLDLE